MGMTTMGLSWMTQPADGLKPQRTRVTARRTG